MTVPLASTSSQNLPWLVQFYSGESLRSSLHQIAREVIPHFLNTHRIVIVCSPCVSLQSSDATSDLLLRAASRVHRQRKRDPHPRQSRLQPRKVGLPSSPRTPVGHNRYDSQTSFENFTSDYFNLEFSNLARSYISDPTIREEVQNVIDEECDWLKDFLGRTKHQPRGVKSLSEDVISSLSERLTAKLLVATLLDQGLPADLISTDQSDLLLDAAIVGDFSSNSLSDGLLAAVEASYPKIPVVTGILWDLAPDVTTAYDVAERLSVLLSNSLGAEELQLWADMNPVTTANATLMSQHAAKQMAAARAVQALSRDEAKALADRGHPFLKPGTLTEIVSKDVRITLRNIHTPKAPGTWVRPPLEDAARELALSEERINIPMSPSSSPQSLSSPLPKSTTAPLRIKKRVHFKESNLSSTSSPEESKQFLAKSKPTTVTGRPTMLHCGDEAVFISVTAFTVHRSGIFLRSILDVLERWGVPLDMVIISGVCINIAFEVDKIGGGERCFADKEEQELVGKLAEELGRYGTVIVKFNQTFLTLIGDSLRNNHRLTSHVVSILSQGAIPVSMVGPVGQVTLSVVVPSKDAVRGLRLLHQTLLRKVANGQMGWNPGQWSTMAGGYWNSWQTGWPRVPGPVLLDRPRERILRVLNQ